MANADSKAKTLDTVSIDAGVLHIHANMSAGTPSSTGKSLIYVSTGGYKPIGETGFSYSLLVIKKCNHES